MYWLILDDILRTHSKIATLISSVHNQPFKRYGKFCLAVEFLYPADHS